MKKLDNLKWVPRWVSHLGCIKGCLDYLEKPISDAWLFGATGHAFILNIAPHMCPSGPTDWNTQTFLKLGKNVGYTFDTVCGWKGKEDLRQLQEQAWEHVKNAIDNNEPCYGWEMDIPEFYVIYGYDNKGYYISGPGCDEGKGPISWRKLGTSEIGVIEVRSVRLTEAAREKKTVKEALRYALEYAHKPGRWTDPKSKGGLEGYGAWIKFIENGTAIHFGLAYNAAVWSECRRFAAEFLKEVRDRLDNPSLKSVLETAIEYFTIVSVNLEHVTKAYPFSLDLSPEPIKVDARANKAVGCLYAAKEAEIAGLDVLSEFVNHEALK